MQTGRPSRTLVIPTLILHCIADKVFWDSLYKYGLVCVCVCVCVYCSKFDDDEKFQLVSSFPEIWKRSWGWLLRMHDVSVCSKEEKLPCLFVRVNHKRPFDLDLWPSIIECTWTYSFQLEFVLYCSYYSFAFVHVPWPTSSTVTPVTMSLHNKLVTL